MINSLPLYSQLTQEQQRLVEFSPDKSMVVSAAPGTGKTVMAIYRAGQLGRLKKKVAILVYNRPLTMYIDGIVKRNGFSVEVNTWHSWLGDFFKKNNINNKKVPTLGPFVHDWPVIKKLLTDWALKNTYVKYDSIIVDEGQDFPIELIECLNLVSKSVTCFLDPNQSIDDNKTDIADIKYILGVRSEFTLNENFRNHKEIFDFAQLYRQSSDVVSEAQPPIGELPVFEKIDGTAISYDKIYQSIDAHKVPYIGVFVENKKLVQVFEELKEKYPGRVFMYKTMCAAANLTSFDKPGIYVLSYACMKGLEFDKVIMPKFDSIDSKHDEETDNNLIYVAITRSAKHFYGIYRYDTKNSSYYIDSMKPFRESVNNKKLVRFKKI